MITDLVFGWAARTPDKTAIVYNGKALSYRWFAGAIAVARGHFARRGYVGPGIAVLAITSLKDVWILSLALRSLGLTVIAIPMVDSVDTLDLPDVRCVVADPADLWPGLEDICASHGLALLLPSMGGETPLGLDATAPPDRPGGQVLLTSGTTGAHKKVLMDPSFESDFVRLRLEVTGVGQDSVVSLFDFPAWTGGGYKSTVAAWTVGATVVIDQRPQRYNTLLHPGITHSLIVPGMLDSLLAAPPGTLPFGENMRLSVTGGALTQRQVEQIKTHITPKLYAGLAATETVSYGYTALDSADDYRWHRLVPGRTVQLVDDADRPVPMGQVGRVRVSTEFGPTSYLNDEEATRTFFKDGFFYPGDLAVMRADGRMALQGRVTDVIIINGHKLSPAPIEDRLREGLGVNGVCLFTAPDAAGEEQMHVIVETPAPIATARLTEVLSRELWGYPRAQVHYTSALPRNAMGKVMRLAARRQVAG